VLDGTVGEDYLLTTGLDVEDFGTRSPTAAKRQQRAQWGGKDSASITLLLAGRQVWQWRLVSCPRSRAPLR
jgi:hypothetical protein